MVQTVLNRPSHVFCYFFPWYINLHSHEIGNTASSAQCSTRPFCDDEMWVGVLVEYLQSAMGQKRHVWSRLWASVDSQLFSFVLRRCSDPTTDNSLHSSSCKALCHVGHDSASRALRRHAPYTCRERCKYRALRPWNPCCPTVFHSVLLRSKGPERQ